MFQLYNASIAAIIHELSNITVTFFKKIYIIGNEIEKVLAKYSHFLFDHFGLFRRWFIQILLNFRIISSLLIEGRYFNAKQ
jgi:hypothetical protein